MASNQNLGNGVLFSAEFNGMVQIPVFRQAHHYKFSKNHFSGCVKTKSFCLLVSAWVVVLGHPFLISVNICSCTHSLDASASRCRELTFQPRNFPRDPERMPSKHRLLGHGQAWVKHWCFEGARFGPCRSTHAFKTNNKKYCVNM